MGANKWLEHLNRIWFFDIAVAFYILGFLKHFIL